MRFRHNGFTLIELMTALAILGILLAIAIPTYFNYQARAKVAEAIGLIGAAKLAVRVASYEGEPTPYTNAKLGLPNPASIVGNNVASVTVTENGVITVLLSDEEGGPLDDKVLQFVPTITAGSILFTCNGEGTTLEMEYRPANCR